MYESIYFLNFNLFVDKTGIKKLTFTAYSTFVPLVSNVGHFIRSIVFLLDEHTWYKTSNPFQHFTWSVIWHCLILVFSLSSLKLSILFISNKHFIKPLITKQNSTIKHTLAYYRKFLTLNIVGFEFFLCENVWMIFYWVSLGFLYKP